jgi:alkylated DNA repair dioxygenase AlkB
MAWYADAGVRYRYSGLQLDAVPLPQALHALRRQLERDIGREFNSVLLNAYRNGDDSMGWHADNEPELCAQPVIASLSLGEQRRFRLRPRAGGASLGLDLEHGSLLLMQGSSQSCWQHAVPKTRRPVGLRINLTFRQIRN